MHKGGLTAESFPAPTSPPELDKVGHPPCCSTGSGVEVFVLLTQFPLERRTHRGDPSAYGVLGMKTGADKCSAPNPRIEAGALASFTGDSLLLLEINCGS